jgi:hypothetical protein
VLGGSNVVTAEVKEIVDPIMGGEEALCMSPDLMLWTAPAPIVGMGW